VTRDDRKLVDRYGSRGGAEFQRRK
jgi:hypothetical protein